MSKPRSKYMCYLSTILYYEEKAQIVTSNNSTNINKTNNHPSSLEPKINAMACGGGIPGNFSGKCVILPSLYAVLIEAYCLLSGSFIEEETSSTLFTCLFPGDLVISLTALILSYLCIFLMPRRILRSFWFLRQIDCVAAVCRYIAIF